MIYSVDELNNAYLAQAKAIHDRYEKVSNTQRTSEKDNTRYFMQIYKKILPRGQCARKLFMDT
ncbi:hypothetical protein CI610_00984 [invertebrate metagenome]|uniref:Uncharacterized protein n=1 Tax=invertebrate metagenome TaxID=1711999 RepID=A0A2H9T9V9_9ZZZZ